VAVHFHRLRLQTSNATLTFLSTQEISMSDPSVLLHQDFPGKCYDIVTPDPLDLATSAKYENVIDISASSDKTQDMGDGKYRIPLGAELLRLNIKSSSSDLTDEQYAYLPSW
jgi:hypothetical protein